MSERKGQCTPKEALIMSVVVLLGGPLVAIATHYVLYTPLQTAFLWYALVAYLATTTAWCCTDWITRRTVVRIWNFGIILFMCILVMFLFTQEEGKSFPRWGIAVMMLQAAVWGVVLAYFATKNILRWRRGEL